MFGRVTKFFHNRGFGFILDKDELHALHVQMIQKQQKEIDELHHEVNDLKQEVADLKQLVNKLLERDSV